MAGIVHLRNDTDGCTCYQRKPSEGRASLEALRCLKRRRFDVVYRQLGRGRHGSRHCGGPGGGPGSTLEGASVIQRHRSNPGHRLVGQATARTRDATRSLGAEGDRSGESRPSAATCRGVNLERLTGRTTLTNDQRRRTLDGLPDPNPLTRVAVGGAMILVFHSSIHKRQGCRSGAPGVIRVLLPHVSEQLRTFTSLRGCRVQSVRRGQRCLNLGVRMTQGRVLSVGPATSPTISK